MFGLLGLVSILGTGYQLIKESFEPTIPAENWANKELYHKDLIFLHLKTFSLLAVPIEIHLDFLSTIAPGIASMVSSLRYNSLYSSGPALLP